MSFSTCLASITNRLYVVHRSIKALSERRIVSKPQMISRLRYVNIVKRCDETQEERDYRIQYDTLQDWNNKYWEENNDLFDREKKEYMKVNFGSSLTSEEALSHDQLAPFYRSFLERNREKHVTYNKVWYRNHLALLSSSLTAKMSRLRVDLTNNKVKT